VTLLGPRAGNPAWGPEILARVHLARGLEQLPPIYEAWERWSADVAESHSSYPSLLRFRSPDSHASWIVSQLAILDAAALHLPIDEDPSPNDPIQLTWEDFLQGWDRLLELGFPVERSAEEAWRHFRGWRVNYESAAYQLAWGIDAVPARWSGPRRYAATTTAGRRFVNRTPDDPEGRAVSPWRPTEPRPGGTV
jgi:hypothetical protein